MAVPSQRTWVSGDTLTAAQLQSDVRNAVNFLINPPMVKVYNSADWTNWAADGTQYLTLWDSESYDTDTMHSTASNTGRITFTTAGVYRISTKLKVPAPGTAWTGGSRIVLEWRLNGTATVVDVQISNPQDGNVASGHSHTFDYMATAADYIQLYTGFSAGAVASLNPALTGGATQTTASALWIGTGA